MLPELVADMSSTSKPQRAGFQCPQCYKVLRTQQGLHYHIDLHRGIYRYKCTYCSKGFSSLTTYKGHVNVYHRERQEQMGAISSYSCPYDRCDKSYPYIQSLRNHISNAHRVGHAICLAYRPDEQQSAILERADPEAAGQVGDSGRSPTDPGSYCGMDLSIHPKPYGQVIFPTPEYVGSQTSAASHIQTCEAERRNEIEVKKLSLDEKL
ncbi:hypothetical protein LSH36_19g06007 [Paralvinella palmiformis]|uniref:C2H2-type domain-containing protein n=1 Tax=Paralvinella palmiformis TaxID=53620 RepID=A0AAD9KBT4_9ANNE|nr:hypothetical protein LSH36_19g06007 [Paralvinella palmiformis]